MGRVGRPGWSNARGERARPVIAAGKAGSRKAGRHRETGAAATPAGCCSANSEEPPERRVVARKMAAEAPAAAPKPEEQASLGPINGNVGPMAKYKLVFLGDAPLYT